MCGDCSEVYAFAFLEAQKRGLKIGDCLADPEDLGFLLSVCVQEAGDFIGFAKSVAAVEDLRGRELLRACNAVVLHCLAIDLLLTEGFDSPSSQWLQQQLCWERIFSGDVIRRGVAALKAAGLGRLRLLYAAEAYSNRKKATTLIDLRRFGRECYRLLNWYIGGCNGDMRDSALFARLFPALYYALEACREDSVLLAEIVVRRVVDPPGPLALDLWLQRRAALRLYDLCGIDPFVRNLDRIRGRLLYYLDLKRSLSEADREALLMVSQRSAEVLDEEEMDLSRWLSGEASVYVETARSIFPCRR